MMNKSLTGWNCVVTFSLLSYLGGYQIPDSETLFIFILGNIIIGWSFYWMLSFLFDRNAKQQQWLFVDERGDIKEIPEHQLIKLIKNRKLPEDTLIRPSSTDEWIELEYSEALLNTLSSQTLSILSRRIVLRAAAMLICLVLLFPPYQQEMNNRVFKTGFGFILSLPKTLESNTGAVYQIGATINSSMLALEILVVIIVSALLYFSSNK